MTQRHCVHAERVARAQATLAELRELNTWPKIKPLWETAVFAQIMSRSAWSNDFGRAVARDCRNAAIRSLGDLLQVLGVIDDYATAQRTAYAIVATVQGEE